MHRVSRVLLSRTPTVRAAFHTAAFNAHSQAKVKKEW